MIINLTVSTASTTAHRSHNNISTMLLALLHSLIFPLIMTTFAAISNAIMDKLQFHYRSSIFPQGADRLLGANELFYNPQISWRNKYRNYPTDKRPRFPFATNALVFITDAWHLAQFLMLTFFTAAIVYPLPHLTPLQYFIGFILIRITFGAVFSLFFHTILNKKKHDSHNPQRN